MRLVDVDVDEGAGRAGLLRVSRRLSPEARAYEAWRAGGFAERMPRELARGLGKKERERRLERFEREYRARWRHRMATRAERYGERWRQEGE